MKFSQPVTLAAAETQTVKLPAVTTSALHIVNPKLWWPNGYGDPNLYTIHVAFRVGNDVSDHKDITFGIRKYSYALINKTLYFHINGIPIFPKGGSWGMAEYLLRCKAPDYDTMVRFQREMNFNMIRNWMGMAPGHVADGFTLSYPADLSATHFIRLRLSDAAGKLVSENCSWRGVTHLDFRSLAELKPVNLKVISQSSDEKGERVITASGTKRWFFLPSARRDQTGQL